MFINTILPLGISYFINDKASLSFSATPLFSSIMILNVNLPMSELLAGLGILTGLSGLALNIIKATREIGEMRDKAKKDKEEGNK